MTRPEIVDKIARYLAAYELRARKRGPNAEEARDVARAVGILATQFIDDVDASFQAERA